jgi:hypothetical protein
MTPERLAEIRNLVDHFGTSEVAELLAEIDRLRAQVAAVELAADRIAVWGYRVDHVRIAQEINDALRGNHG